MDAYTLEFEPPDLAGWLWVAAGVLAGIELIRYLWSGRRPAGRATRAGVAAAVMAVLAAAVASGKFRLDASTHEYACLALAGFGIAWLTRAYRQTTRSLAPSVRTTLLVARLLALAMILLLAARPVLQWTQIMRERAVLGIAVDDSRSMTVRDAPADAQPDTAKPVSRLEAVRAALDASSAALNRLQAELDVRWFTFDADLAPTAWPALSGSGTVTALADAVRQVHTVLEQTQRKVAGVILVSDGRDNFSAGDSPEAVAAALAGAGIPLHTVGVGSEVPTDQTRSLQARRLEAPDRIAAHNRLIARAEFLATGLADVPIKIELLMDGEGVDAKQLRTRQASELIRVELTHTPARGGLHRVTVRARTLAIEGERRTAELSQFVQVTEDKVQVLYIDRPRYERAAVARALATAGELRVTKINVSQPDNRGASPAVPKTPAELGQYDVVLIGDVDRLAFPKATLRAIRDLAATRGQGLAMLGGLRTLGSGEYAATPLAEVVPVDLAAAGHWPGPLAFELTSAGREHPACRLDPDQAASEAMWKRLPPLTGASQLAGIAPAAEVLIRSDAGEPLLVVRETGKGRTAIVAFDSTWQWSFIDERGSDSQRRFWRQLVLWLANRRPAVWVTTDRSRYDLARLRTGGEPVVVRAGVTDPITGGMAPDTVLAATLTEPGGQSRSIPLVARPQGLEGRLSPQTVGAYRIDVVAKSGETVVGDAQAAFVVTSIDQELSDPTADLQMLKRMAAQTQHIGGSYVSIAELRPLLERIGAAGYVTEITQTRRWHLVEDYRWVWLTAFIALVTIEWILRRRKGLV